MLTKLSAREPKFQSAVVDFHLLFGIENDGEVIILANAALHTIKAVEVVEQIQFLQPLLPGGVGICGIAVYEQSFEDVLSKYEPALKHPFCSKVVVVQVDKDGAARSVNRAYAITADNTISEVEVKWTSKELLNSDFVITRARCDVLVSFNLGSQDSWIASLHTEIEKLIENIASDSTMFHLMSCNGLLSSRGCYGIPNGSTSGTCGTDGYEGTLDKKRKDKGSLRSVIFDVFVDLSCQSLLDKTPSCAPIINYNTGQIKLVSITLPIDAVSLFPCNTPVAQMAHTMCEAVAKQIVAMEQCICKYSKNGHFVMPVPYHFQPLEYQLFFTIVYPHDVTDLQLETQRREIHQNLGFPVDRPLFRRTNQVKFTDSQQSSGYLLNVHKSVPCSQVVNGTCYLVQGNYTYHHYMQDRVDDNRWGCAYRSLQTLASWFILQGYTDRDIPSHKEIQQTLVKIGDKSPSFIGSNMWIGSMEVSYVLEHLLGVTCKIINVSYGADLASKGRELAAHFSTQGTPVMIGGGVLAHTILGIDYNEVTGDISFLILDPHYTGAEDIKVIVDKGWCGWKKPIFWDQNAHYNMCLPQRPCTI